MVCAGLEVLQNQTITDLLGYPTTCDFQFYAKIMVGFWLIISLVLYNNDKNRLAKPDMISSMGVSAIATLFVTIIGTLAQFIQTQIFIEIFVFCAIFIVIWLLKDE